MSQFLFDRYSTAHAAWGVMFAAWGVSAPVALVAHVLFEAAEDQMKHVPLEVWPDTTPDSFTNHVGDTVSFAAGYWGAKALRRAPGGVAALSSFVALAAGIWVANLLGDWERRPG